MSHRSRPTVYNYNNCKVLEYENCKKNANCIWMGQDGCQRKTFGKRIYSTINNLPALRESRDKEAKCNQQKYQNDCEKMDGCVFLPLQDPPCTQHTVLKQVKKVKNKIIKPFRFGDENYRDGSSEDLEVADSKKQYRHLHNKMFNEIQSLLSIDEFHKLLGTTGTPWRFSPETHSSNANNYRLEDNNQGGSKWVLQKDVRIQS